MHLTAGYLDYTDPRLQPRDEPREDITPRSEPDPDIQWNEYFEEWDR